MERVAVERPLAVPPSPSALAGRELITVLGTDVTARGTAPRQVARYRPGAAARVTITGTGHGSERLWPGQRTEHDLPAFRRSFTLTPAAGASYRLSDATTSVDDGGIASARASAQALVATFAERLSGREASVGIDARGVIGDVRGTGGTDWAMRREIASILAEHVVVFPDLPIGRGARWTVTLAVPTAGGYAKQRIHYRLTARRGDELTVHVDGARVMERQPAVSPDLPAGVHAEVLVMKSTFAGTATVSLRHPMPVTSAMQVTRRFHGRTTAGSAHPQDYTSSFDGHVTEEARIP